MKLFNWILGLLMVSTLVFAGCGKSDQPAPADSTVRAIDASKFRPAFSSASVETKAIVDNVMMSIQGVNYKGALAGLHKLAHLPDLTEPQKKVVADLTEQVKRKLSPPQ
jgi:PBP1b-binding outer membrane lipoprotein LpoB